MRAEAVRLRAPQSVLRVLDHHVEIAALNRHWKPDAGIRIGYGRHSPKEREWDQRRRGQLIDEGLPKRRLIQLPNPGRDGLAEKQGMWRQTAILAGHWLAARHLVRRSYTQDVNGKTYGGTHPVPVRKSGPHAGVEHEMGRGGCLPGGIGLAVEWFPIPPGTPAPAPPPPPRDETAPEPPATGLPQWVKDAVPRGGPRPRGP